jgi:hypothetical protein
MAKIANAFLPYYCLLAKGDSPPWNPRKKIKFFCKERIKDDAKLTSA